LFVFSPYCCTGGFPPVGGVGGVGGVRTAAGVTDSCGLALAPLVVWIT
jgi:hypothetical protein